MIHWVCSTSTILLPGRTIICCTGSIDSILPEKPQRPRWFFQRRSNMVQHKFQRSWMQLDDSWIIVGWCLKNYCFHGIFDVFFIWYLKTYTFLELATFKPGDWKIYKKWWKKRLPESSRHEELSIAISLWIRGGWSPTIWLFNIAMAKSLINGGFNGKFICKWAIFP